MKYKMRAWLNVYVSAVVEAESEEAAIIKAKALASTDWTEEDHGSVDDIKVQEGQ